MSKLFVILILACFVFFLGCEQKSGDVGSDINPDTDDGMQEVINEQPDDGVEPGKDEPGIDSTPTDGTKDSGTGITVQELAKHNSEDDCWIVYEGKVYDYTNTPRHPNMGDSFFRHCGKESGFEEGAKARHSGSNEDRVKNYGPLVGELEK